MRPAGWEDKLLVGEVRVRENDVTVCFEYIGEGSAGDFDDADPHDTPFLRFDARDEREAKRERWTKHDGFESYCTALPAWTERAEIERVARLMAQDLAARRDRGESFGTRCEELSWVGAKKTYVGVGDATELL